MKLTKKQVKKQYGVMKKHNKLMRGGIKIKKSKLYINEAIQESPKTKTEVNMENYSKIIKEANDKKTERLTFRLSKHELKTVDRIAAHYRISRGEVLRVGVKVLANRLLDIRWRVIDKK